MQNFSSPFGWSTSRMTLFHHCHKKYYFQYYTNTLKSIGTDLRLDWLLLKNLTSFNMRLGEKTHHIIADYLRLLAKNASSQRQEASSIWEDITNLKSSIRSSMQHQFGLAKTKNYNEYNKEQKFGFKELCYGEALDEKLEAWIQKVWWNLDALIVSDLHDTLLHFFSNGYKHYIEANESDFEQMKLVLDHHPILQDVTIWAWPDFGITCPDNTYYIYDRKSWTQKDIPQDSITDQLKVYAYKLLCNTKKTLDEVTIYTYEVYLPSMYMIGGKVQQTDIDSIKQKIVDDVHELQSMTIDGNIKNNTPKHIDTFVRTTDTSKCDTCMFKRLCAKLKKIDDENTPNAILDRFVSSNKSPTPHKISLF